MRSASLYMRLPRWEADIFLHAPFSNAARAALTALSTSGASASATWVMTSPVEGLMVGKVLPEVLLTHWPLMSSLVALILTVGSNAVVAVAMKPPNLVRAEGGCGALPFATSSAKRELSTEKTSYTSKHDGASQTG